HGTDGKLRLWDAAKKQVVRTIEAGWGAKAMSADRQLFALTNGTTVRLWKTLSGEELNLRPTGPVDQLFDLKLAPGGKHLIVLSSWPHGWIWDMQTGIAELFAPMGVRGVAFSP